MTVEDVLVVSAISGFLTCAIELTFVMRRRPLPLKLALPVVFGAMLVVSAAFFVFDKTNGIALAGLIFSGVNLIGIFIGWAVWKIDVTIRKENEDIVRKTVL